MGLSSMSHYTDGGTAVWYGIVNADGSSPGGGTYTNGNDPPVSSQPAAEWGRLTYVARRVCTSGYDNNGGLCPSTVGNPGNVAFFGLYNGTSKYYPGRQTALVYGTTVYLGDRTPPNRPTFSGLPASGWVRPGTSFGIAATQGGIGIQGFRLNFPAAGYNNRFLGVSCSLSYQPPYAPCPQQASATIGIPTTTAEGIHQVSANATTYDLSGSSSSTTVRLDGSGPTLEPAGRLWDHRNQQTDHRREGLYDQSYSVQLKAGDGSTASQAAQRSGTKAIDVRVRNAAGSIVQNSPDPAPQTCAAGNCAKTRHWTVNTNSLPDGDFTIEVLATDQIANTSTKTWPVTIDRRGDVYGVEALTGDPQAPAPAPAPDTGELLERESGRLGTYIGRSEDADGLATRAVVPCDEAQPAGAQCGETRHITKDEAGGLEGDIAVVRSNDPDDENLPMVAEMLAIARSDPGDPAARGTLVDAVEAWQTPPPARGTEYLRFDTTEDWPWAPSSGDDDEYDTPEQAGEQQTQLFVDERTRLPLKARVTGSDGSIAFIYWDYARNRRETSELPADFFRAKAPGPPEAESETRMQGNVPIGATRDRETGGTFTGFHAGPVVTLAAGVFCLGSRTSFEQHAESFPESADYDDADTSRNFEDITRLDAAYGEVAAAPACQPGDGDMTEAPLDILAYDRDSSAGADLREFYEGAGTAIQLDPTDDWAFRGGVVPLMYNLQPIVAYVAPVDEYVNSAYFELAGSAVQIMGPFQKEELDELVSQLDAL
jgi:hypothetical protein